MTSHTGQRGYPAPRAYPLAAPTPHFRMPAETPLGKIRPVFDDFSLAEMSDYIEPPTPAPPHSHKPALPTELESRRPADVFDATPKVARDPRIKRLQHKTPDTKRRRREEFYTPAAAAHPDDFFSRRLTDSSRRTSLAPLPLDPQREVQRSSLASSTASSGASVSSKVGTFLPPPIVQARALSSLSVSTARRDIGSSVRASPELAVSQVAQRPETQVFDPIPAPKTIATERGPSRAERARAAGIPVLASRVASRPARTAARPVATRRKDPSTAQMAVPPSPASLDPPAIPPPTRAQQLTSPRRRSKRVATPPCSSLRPATGHHRPTRSSSSHETPLSRPQHHSTPASLVSIAAHASTLDGLPEFWDLSMSTPAPASPAKVSWGRQRHNLPSDNTSVHTNPTPPAGEDKRDCTAQRELATSQHTSRELSIRSSTTQASSRQAPTSSSQQNSTPRSRPPSHVDTAAGRSRAQRVTPADHSRRESSSSSFFGFLTAVFGASPFPPAPVPAPQPAMRSVNNSRVTRPAQPPPAQRPPPLQRSPPSKRQPRVDDHCVRPVSKKAAAAAEPILAPHGAKSPRPKTQRQPLAEARGINANVNQAPVPGPKRKQPPSPVKAHPEAAAAASLPPSLPSYARSTSASRFATAHQPPAAAKPPRTTMRPHLRTTLRTSSSASTYSHHTAPLRVTSFVADHLARMPKPGEGASKHSEPVSIRDHERARELAIKRAVFERSPHPENEAPLPPHAHSQSNGRRHVSAPVSTFHPTKPSHVPGEATRRRAEIQAANRERRNQKDAEEALRKAEEARIRAAVEAEYDRQARERAVFRANPLPEMYGPSRYA